MDNKEYKYDAFISYRHTELDKYVAENLHKALESYELPKSIRKKLNIKKTFRRVFRDQEELPLTSNLEDPIVEALKNSKYLIVICSPRLKESLWCKKEIEIFKSLRGRKNIFCVLVEAEPKDSFPEEVLSDEEGNLVEPLAADVRGKNKKEILKKIKDEKLRLIAPMYNLDYDDLRQRHKQRKQKRILTISIAVSIFCILFTIYSLIMFIKINTQQNILAKHQALSLAKESEEYLNNDDRYSSVLSAYKAITKFEDVNMPYTSEAEYALSESLGIYDIGSSYKTIKEYKTKGVVDYIKNNNDGSFIAIYDESEEISLINSKTLELIKTYNTKDSLSSENSFSFIGNDLLAFINDKGNISLVNTKDGNLVKELEKNEYSYYSLQGDTNGKYLVYLTQYELYIYDVIENKEVYSTSTKDKYLKNIYFSLDGNYLFIPTVINSFDINKDDSITIHVIDINNKKQINEIKVNAGYINGVITKDNNAFILLNNMVGNKYNVLVVSYNFINGNVNWSKTIENNWSRFISRSYPNNTNNLAIANHDTINIFDIDGNFKETFNMSSEIINIYSYKDINMYLVFLSNGSVVYLNMDSNTSIEYKGKYDFKLKNYSKVALSENGFILLPNNDNRVILYEAKYNKNRKEEDIKLEYPSDDSIKIKEFNEIKEEYNLKNKNLVERMIYDTNKKILFVNYKNNDILIYDVNSKKLLKELKNIGKVNHYFGKDKYNRIYVGDISDSYILDKDYNIVGHIKGLSKLEDDKVIISNDSEKFYSIKIYSLDEIINEAKEYLEKQ